MVKEKKIFSKTVELNMSEYVKMFKAIPDFYWSVLKKSCINLMVVLSLIELYYKMDLLNSIIFDSVTILLISIIYKIKIDWLAKKIYTQLQNKNKTKYSIINDFYKTYLIVKDGVNQSKYMYSDMDKIIETNTNIYLCFGKYIYFVCKEKCTKDINFIRNINPNIYYNKEGKNNSKMLSIKQQNFISKLLLVIFIATIFSIYGALITIGLSAQNIPNHLVVKKLWIFWLWLPIPILSIILGLKYKKYEIKCSRNITAGIIISILLFILGLFSVIF